MKELISKLGAGAYPALLKEIPDPPKQLYLRGILPADDQKFLTVVGSRRYTEYGQTVCQDLISNLTGYPLVVVSGLALGIDAIAHRAALKAGITCLGVPGSGLTDAVIYPRSHCGLAKEILESGGALLSEYEPDFCAQKWSFVQRNRIMAGLSHATLVIEAGEKAGTLVTSRLALEYNRDVFTVPGSIYSTNSAGPHQLLRLGATPITSSNDLLEALELTPLTKTNSPPLLDETEALIFDHLTEAKHIDQLALEVPMDESVFNAKLMQLELSGRITNNNGMLRRHDS